MAQGFGPPDFPPRKLDPAESSSPLVTKESSHFVGEKSRFAERATHRDLVDLITGNPLLQETDFELPFGGAVFRHVRTYAEDVAAEPMAWCENVMGGQSGGWCIFEDYPHGQFWDWFGMNWMMSENPIFLIDAQYESLVTPSPKRCYFIPDAHHAIPFEWNEAEQRYEAPSWFDADLKYEGDPNRPTRFYVRMHRKSTTYMIEPLYEDLWKRTLTDGRLVSVHDAPPLGLGYPYLGLVKSIEDRYGNTVEMTYCDDFHQYACDADWTDNCTECCQNCNHKGQLSAVRLRDHTGVIIWTLLYTYRGFGFGDGASPFPQMAPGLRSPTAVHAIYVYKGGGIDVENYKCLDIGYQPFTELYTFDEHDTVDAAQLLNLPGNWVFKVSYLYQEESVLAYKQDHSTSGTVLNPYCTTGPGGSYLGEPGVVGTGRNTPLLLKATVTRRDGQDDQHLQEIKRSNSIYWYWDPGPYSHALLRSPSQTQLIRSVFYDDTINEILKKERETNPDVTENVILEDTTFASKADLSFDGNNANAGAWPDQTTRNALVTFANLNLAYTTSIKGGLPYFSDHRKGQDEGDFVLYRFQVFPDDPAMEVPSLDGHVRSQHPAFDPTLYHYPFRVPTRAGVVDCQKGMQRLDPEFGDTRFVMIIDERLRDERGLLKPYDASTPLGVRSRRIVEINPAGFVLKDRTWSFETDQTGQLVDQSGLAEEFVYDSCGHGKILERKTIGWNAAKLQGHEATEGLIHVYKYDSESGGCPDRDAELAAVGIKNGDNGPPYYINYTEREPDHKELITRQVQFPIPVSDYLTASGEETTVEYDFFPTTNPPGSPRQLDKDEADRPIREKITRKPATPLTLDGTPVHGIEHAVYDEKGNLLWLGQGAIDPANPEQPGQFFVTHGEYDDFGRQTLNVIDADPNLVPALPAGWSRVADHEPLHLATETTYSFYGITKVVYPNGREQHIAYVPDTEDPEGMYVWVYPEVNPTTLAIGVPVEIQHIIGGNPKSSKKVRIPVCQAYPPVGTESYTQADVISESEILYDESGRRPVGIEQNGENASLSAAIAYHPTGQVARQQDPDGTITRYSYDQRGRLERTFVGTCDEDEYWGTDCDPVTDPGCSGCTDNLVLREKRSYGPDLEEPDQDSRNAGRLVGTREYRDKPSNQYYHYEEDPENPGEYIAVPAIDEDELGRLTKFYYDWRMRQVWEKRFDDSTPAGILSNSLTWYDNLDRVVMVAKYGPTVPAGITDPTELLPGQVPPSPTSILSAGGGLLSLTENVYNQRGLAQESREYAVDIVDGSYTSTLTFYDQADRTVEMRSPNSPIHRYEYDAKGRQMRSWTVADGKQITKTRTIYDYNDRAIQTIQLERRHNAAGSVLDDTTDPQTDNDSVRSWVLNWYDKSGRIIATADYGTNNSIYASGPDPIGGYDPEAPPTTTASDVKITRFEYDADGRQSAIHHPDGTTTRTEYDGLGRQLLATENADDEVAANRRHTAYRYDDQGRLERMAAVLPSHQSGITEWPDIHWDASDGSLQITRFEYGADVVGYQWDSTAEARLFGDLSDRPALIKAVYYPHPATGQPNEQADLTFTYHSDRSVASRTDAKGNTFRYAYDELGRLVQTDVETVMDSQLWYANTPSPPYTYSPAPAIDRITYAYGPDGKLDVVTAYNGSTILAQNAFEYDGRRNLWKEHQYHGDPATFGHLPYVEYTWDFSAADTGNHDRLSHILYPARPENSSVRDITVGYDDASCGCNSNRIAQISEGSAVYAEYTYAGTSRRVGRSLDEGHLTQTFGADMDYYRLDRFGRILTLEFINSGASLYAYRYAYDMATNRVNAFIRQATVNGIAHNNDRSFKYVYDKLQRLVAARMGYLVNGDVQPAGGRPFRGLAWVLDNLGNFAGDPDGDPPASLVRETDTDADGGINVTESIHHGVDSRNEIDSVTRKVNSNPLVTTPYIHDPNGNLVFDGAYVYQYDAWNRLVEVNARGDFTDDDFDGLGRIAPSPETDRMGTLIYRFAYDGLGRLITVSTVYDGTAPDPRYRDVHYYYYGVRRLQEVVETPDAEVGQPPTFTTKTEFIYGPDYVDEFLLQVEDPAGTPTAYYMLQDGNYNVIGLVEDNTGTVLEQYAWEPYGLPAAVDTATGTSTSNQVGHQGLFFYPLDGGSGFEADAKGLYYNRNRWYSPQLGRFLQPDPKATGLPLMAGAGSLSRMTYLTPTASCDACGCQPDVLPDPIDGFVNARAPYADGLNLLIALGSNPVNRWDPTGLSLDMLLAAALGANTDASKAKSDMASATSAAALVTLLAYFYIETIDAAIREISRIERQRRRDTSCYCKCIKQVNGRSVAGPDPVGNMSRSQCKSFPLSPANLAGYTYCFCRGDP